MPLYKENEFIAQSVIASSTSQHKPIPDYTYIANALKPLKVVNSELPKKYRPIKPLKGDMPCGLWHLQRINVTLGKVTTVAYYYTNSMIKLRKWVFKHHGVFFPANQYLVPTKIKGSKTYNTAEYRLVPITLKTGCLCSNCNPTKKNVAPVYLILESYKDPWRIGTYNSIILKEKIIFHKGVFPKFVISNGINIDAWKKTWQFDSGLNMIQACADFSTLYDLLLDFPDDATIKELFNAHQKQLLQQFVGYTDMVIGGELRHLVHKIPYVRSWNYIDITGCVC